jgi:hypothetical protein
MLRTHFKCHLPVEVWTYANESRDIPRQGFDALHKLSGVSIRILEPLLSDSSPFAWDRDNDWVSDFRGFSIKPRALVNSHYRNVLLLDADTVLFVSPETIFATKQFRETGSLLLWDHPVQWWPHWYPRYDSNWIDKLISSSMKAQTNLEAGIYSSIPVFRGPAGPDMEFPALKRSKSPDQLNRSTYSESTNILHQYAEKGSGLQLSPHHLSQLRGLRTEHTCDSSLVAIDRLRHARGMKILSELSNFDNGPDVYSHIYGDKETFWLALHISGRPYAFSEYSVSHWAPGRNGNRKDTSGTSNGTEKGSACAGTKEKSPGMLHYLPGKPKTLMSLNGCKEEGCLRYGLRTLRLTPAVKREAHLDAVIEGITKEKGTIEKNEMNQEQHGGWVGLKPLPMQPGWPPSAANEEVGRKAPIGAKDDINGRLSPGVLQYGRVWLRQPPCKPFPSDAMDLLLSRRAAMLEARRLLCSSRACAHLRTSPKKKRKGKTLSERKRSSTLFQTRSN